MLSIVEVLNVPVYYGLSTDGKPSEKKYGPFPTGTVFVEMDSSAIYVYNAESKKWIPQH